MVDIDEISSWEICQRVKKLGYTPGSHIHMYGERWEVLSDPFPLDGGIAVNVRVRGGAGNRIIKLPATVLQSAKKNKRVPTSA